MKKSKIAISLDKSLLEEVDKRVDGKVIRSRSQAMEVFLRKGLFESEVKVAVILLRGEHQKHAVKEIDGRSLVRKQIEFFARHGIERVIVVTQKSDMSLRFMKEISDAKLPVDVFEDEAKGNGHALWKISSHLREPFVVISGDTYNEFDLSKMVRKLLSSSQLAVMGLMSRSKKSIYGVAVIDGDLIVDFVEKPSESDSLVVNAGIYCMKPEVFSMMEDAKSLEKDLFPKLAKERQLLGFFTHGKYSHFSDEESG